MNARSVTFLAYLIPALAAWSQVPSFIFFECEAPVDRSTYKHIIEAVKDADPMAEVFHSDDMTILQVRTTNGVDERTYRAAIERTGVPLRAGTRTAQDLGLDRPTSNGPPVFIVTGDPAADLARYQAAVEAWNMTHPDQRINAVPIHQTDR